MRADELDPLPLAARPGSKGRCPRCDHPVVGTIDSRDTRLGRRRTRRCARCLARWTTVEVPAEFAERVDGAERARAVVEDALERTVARLQAALAALREPPPGPPGEP